MEQLKKLVEQSNLQLVMLDPDDVAGLANLRTQFEKIGVQASQITSGPIDKWQLVQGVSSGATELIESIILQDVEDLSASMVAVVDTAKALQELLDAVAEGNNPDAIKFPELLALDKHISPVISDQDAQSQPAQNDHDVDIQALLPENVDEEIFREFLAGQPDTLNKFENAVLAAENDNNADNVNAVKALLHNMKGETALMGQTEYSFVCHELETLLADEEGGFPAEKLLAAKDWFQKVIDYLCGNISKQSVGSFTLDQSKEAVSLGDVASEPPIIEKQEQQDDILVIAESDVALVAEFIGESSEHLESAEADLLSIEDAPEDPETINSIFRAFHTIKGVAGFLNLKQIGALAHAAENLLDLSRKGQLKLIGPCIDVIFESIDVMKHMLSALRQAVEQSKPVKPAKNLDQLIDRIKACISGEQLEPRMGELLVQSGDAKPEQVRQALKEQRDTETPKPIGKILVEKEIVSEEQIQKVLKTQTEIPKEGSGNVQARKVATETTVKVTTGRLDNMINMVGELVIAQAMVNQDIEAHVQSNQRLERNARHLDKITRDLQELSMSMRMVPVQGVFQKMARLIRDLSRKSGKQIDFIMNGAETELDRNMVEAIADPLVHMVRNSVDHGVEGPEDRLAAGKNKTGKVELRAFHKGGSIVIEIRDDGRGLNREKILKKAIANGIVKEGQEISDQEIYRLIFHAGLSTAEQITSISGRGVGMDVVRKNIEALRGRVDIDSKPGLGTVFSIYLPLTLAVIDGQIVTVGKERFIIPIISIEQNLRPSPDMITTVQGGRGEMMLIRGNLLPLVRLYDIFGIQPENDNPCESLVVIVADGNNRCCLQVDSLLGQQQVVIKSLGDYLGNTKGISGGAIMGDGNVSLIVDVPGLINLASDVVETVGC
ncbi:MAG: Hpt domain-containing protein [Phycisphaerae bacterium]|nr:Hpt domain-containing protein [Phycisphaerae bacterium]